MDPPRHAMPEDQGEEATCALCQKTFQAPDRRAPLRPMPSAPIICPDCLPKGPEWLQARAPEVAAQLERQVYVALGTVYGWGHFSRKELPSRFRDYIGSPDQRQALLDYAFATYQRVLALRVGPPFPPEDG